MKGERLIIGTEGVGEDVLTGLLVVAAKWQLSNMADLNRLGSELEAGVRTVLAGRRLHEWTVIEAHGFPSWQACVDALPPEVGGEV